MLIERIFNMTSIPGDLVLDSFLGSGTTAAVAQKWGVDTLVLSLEIMPTRIAYLA